MVFAMFSASFADFEVCVWSDPTCTNANAKKPPSMMAAENHGCTTTCQRGMVN